MDKTILDTLKSEEDIRLTFGRKWMIWSELNNEWEIWEYKSHNYRSKSILVFSTTDEKEAVFNLMK